MASGALARTRPGRAAALGSRERVERALAGKDLDRPPFTFWHHFGLTSPEAHAARTLEFHRAYRTDLVKVMSDFPYPKAASGKWHELSVQENPFPAQIRALERIRDGLGGSAYFVETVFNPWNVAQKLASKEEVLRLKEENPQALLDALDVITQSEIRHARRAFAVGLTGVLFSVASAVAAELSVADYEKFSRPFDRRFFDAVSGAPHTLLHLHVEPPYLDQFRDFGAPIVNYSLHASGIPLVEMRRRHPSAALAGGLDERDYRALRADRLREQWRAAARACGPRFVLTPGCSVPNDSTPEELARLPKLLGAL